MPAGKITLALPINCSAGIITPPTSAGYPCADSAPVWLTPLRPPACHIRIDDIAGTLTCHSLGCCPARHARYCQNTICPAQRMGGGNHIIHRQKRVIALDRFCFKHIQCRCPKPARPKCRYQIRSFITGPLRHLSQRRQASSGQACPHQHNDAVFSQRGGDNQIISR